MAYLTNKELHAFFDKLKNADKTTKVLYKQYPYSVTKVLDTLKRPFDKEKKAEEMFQKYYDVEGHQYYHKETWEIINMWEEKADISRKTGSMLDDYIGAILTDNIELASKLYNSDSADEYQRRERFDNFKILYKEVLQQNNFEYACREIMLFDGNKFLKGRFDAIFIKGDKICLFDWKSNEKLSTESSYGNMLGPLYKYDDCDLNGYTIQLYIYKYILKNVYGIDNEIIPCLCRIGPDKFEIYNHNIEYSDKLVEDIFKWAKQKLIENK